MSTSSSPGWWRRSSSRSGREQATSGRPASRAYVRTRALLRWSAKHRLRVDGGAVGDPVAFRLMTSALTIQEWLPILEGLATDACVVAAPLLQTTAGGTEVGT